MNYKNLYGVTLAQAKRHCKACNGRLPKVGRMIYIASRQSKVKSLQGFYYDAISDLYLVNYSGKLELREFTRVAQMGESLPENEAYILEQKGK